VADGALTGGACKTNGLVGEVDVKADGGSTIGDLLSTGDSEISESDLNCDGGRRGDMAYWEKAGDLGPKPGVFGADWVRSCARYRSERARSRMSIDFVRRRFV
jgi:hypothetical protein